MTMMLTHMKKLFITGITGLALFGGLFFAQSCDTQDQYEDITTPEVNDITIESAIETELKLDRSVPSEKLTISVDEGIATITGVVDNILSYDRITETASSVRGVRSVVNNVEVLPAEKSDEEIHKEILSAVAVDPVTELMEVNVSVEDGVVTLTGVAGSLLEKDLTADVIKGVSGVKQINNNMMVEFDEDRSDQEIKEELEQVLEADAFIENELLDISVENGHVAVSGTVGSAIQKLWIQDYARMPGVETYADSMLTVDADAAAVMKKEFKYVMKTDEEIEEALMDAFTYDIRLDADEITIAVEAGVVTLGGTVASLQQKYAAEETAKHTTGVWLVHNNILVEPAVDISDQKLEGELRAAFVRDPFLNKEEVLFSVDNGTVTLEGNVNSLYLITHAEEITSTVAGVQNIDNNIIFDPTPVVVGDQEMKVNIEAELFWNPLIDAENISVKVDEGTAMLNGEVLTKNEALTAADEAREAGALEVENNLAVRLAPEAQRVN